MKHVAARIEERKARVAAHPFYRWVQTARAPLDRRFDFAPVLVNFIMTFADMNKWFMRYASPATEYERCINKHTNEDETHSRLYIEDWRKLGLDRRLGWGAGDTLAWYYASPDTETFREHGMDILRMLTCNPDPLVRFALMEAIEAWGHVMFSTTAGVAAELTKRTGTEYRYFGPYHLRRELGHLLAGGKLFENATLDDAQRRDALALVDRLFDIADSESDRLLRFAEGVIDAGGVAPTARPAPVRERRAGDGPPSRRPADGDVAASRARVQRVLDERKRAAAAHPLFRWMRDERDGSAESRLQRVALFWAPDCMGYRDLNAHALTYASPRDASERALNRWVADLGTHHRLFLQDWSRLGMDERLGFSASDTIDFYCRSAHSEEQRRSMAEFVKLAFLHPDAPLRFWLLEALEASGEAFFDNTQRLARRVEAERGVRLDYLANRHDASHAPLAPDPEADAVSFKSSPLTPEQADVAVAMVNTVFDRLERQFTASLEQATGAATPLAA